MVGFFTLRTKGEVVKSRSNGSPKPVVANVRRVPGAKKGDGPTQVVTVIHNGQAGEVSHFLAHKLAELSGQGDAEFLPTKAFDRRVKDLEDSNHVSRF
jgi:hypothetical protein